MEMFCKVGDSIGIIHKGIGPGDTTWKWCLGEAKVRRVGITKNGVRIYTKNYIPLDVEDIKVNTDIMTSKEGLVIKQEPFLLTDETRERALTWIENMNNNYVRSPVQS